MTSVAGFGRLAIRPWLWSAAALLLFTACGTTPSTRSVDPNAVDIGYGEVDPDHEVGAVPTVRGDEEGAPRFRSLVEMLSRVPGVRVQQRNNGEVTVRIRGATSFNSSEDPLFVVDGMAAHSMQAVMQMNPNTIESITVLRDAGDTAIYGSRGANGVILIRTKRGGSQ